MLSVPRALSSTLGASRWRLALAVTAVGVLLVHAATPYGVLGQVTYLVFTGGGAAVALVAGRRLSSTAGRVWTFVAWGLVFSAVADAYWAVHILVAPPVPDVSAADPFWLLSYGFLIAAFFALLHNRGDGNRDDLEGLIDTGATLVISVLVLWQLVIVPVLDDHSVGLLTRWVWASYPALDAVLVALVARCVVSRRASSKVGGLLAGGAALWLLADLGTNFWEIAGAAGALLDAGWMVGAALMGWAAWAAADDQRHGRTLGPAPAVARRITPWRAAVTVMPLLVPAGLHLWSDVSGYEDPYVLTLGTVTLTALVGVRLLLFLRTRDEADRRLLSSERLYKALAANSADGVLLLDAHGRITNEDAHVARLLGHPGSSIRGARALDSAVTADRSRADELFAEVLASPGTVFEGEVRVAAADGSQPWLAVRAVNLLEDPDVGAIVVNIHGISDRKRAEEELVHMAFHDSLTGLANRALFHARMDKALLGDAGSAAVLFLDLDGLKRVNDALGHEAGDELLRHVADQLVRSARPEDTVARMGGDEFALLLERCDDPLESAVTVADRILTELTVPVQLADGPAALSASIGIAIPERDSSASSVLRGADIAMYEAKSAGRGRWCVYTPDMRTATLERMQLEQDLDHALERDELRVEYQPVVELASGSIVGFEALLRWDHPTLGLISPDRFIPLAEQNGLIIPIGRWVLDTACLTAAQWQQQHQRDDLTMAVNISAVQLASSDLVSHAEDALVDSGLSAASLVLELTETVLVEDPITVAGRLRQLQRLGVRLAIDDFGSGYSSLSYLRQFPVDILKIDRSFVSTMTDVEDVPALVHGLLDLGHTMRLEMVAEGIETSVQLEHLRAQRCQLGQGYLFSRPLSPEKAGLLLAGPGFAASSGPNPLALADTTTN